MEALSREGDRGSGRTLDVVGSVEAEVIGTDDNGGGDGDGEGDGDVDLDIALCFGSVVVMLVTVVVCFGLHCDCTTVEDGSPT